MTVVRPGRAGLWAGLMLVLVLGSAGCGGSHATGSTTGGSTPSNFDFGSNDPHRASAFGDSITLGVLALKRKSSDLITSNNYPNLLQGMLRGLGPAWRVVNRGAGGETTSAGVRRLPTVLAIDRPGFLLLMEGTNDASAEDDPAFIVSHLEAMVLAGQRNKSIVLIATIPPNFRNDPPAHAIIDSANGLIRTMAKARRAVLVEIFDGMNNRGLWGLSPDTDPLHPNEAGYAVMAGIWFDGMQRAIPPPAPPSPDRKTPTGAGLRPKGT